MIFSHVNPALFHAEISRTRDPGHATRLASAAAAEGMDIVVACGGDGTVNGVASALAGTQAALSILPLGSGNGLARHLGIPLATETALRNFNHGTMHMLDTISLNGRLAVNVAGLGFDAQVAHAFAHMPGRGFRNYARAVWKEYSRSKEQVFSVETEAGHTQHTAWMLSMCNSSQFGNNYRIAPAASSSDGLMDICLLRKIPLLQLPVQAHRLYWGSIQNSRYYTTFQTSNLTLHLPSPMPAHIDGEPCILQGQVTVCMGPTLQVWH